MATLYCFSARWLFGVVFLHKAMQTVTARSLSLRAPIHHYESAKSSGTSMPPCCVVNAIILYTLIHWIIPNTTHTQMVDYLRVGRTMFCPAILITRIP